MNNVSVLAVFAHPDDESFGIAGAYALLEQRGIATGLITVTRGQAGQIREETNVEHEELAAVRELELRCAADVMGVDELRILDYLDGGLPHVDPNEAIGQIVQAIRELRPQVLITFGPEGIYGHPDHLMVHRWTTTAFADAGDPARYPEQIKAGLEPHSPAKLYYQVIPDTWAKQIDEQSHMHFAGYPDDVITTIVDVGSVLHLKRQALRCHATQLDPEGEFTRPPTDEERAEAREHYILVASRVGWPASQERDLLERINQAIRV